MAGLRPFWRYYGGKWRAAPRYPAPRYATIVEPFAGAAGYSLRYPDRQVVLVERYAVIAEIWRYLISVTPAEVRRIPAVEHVDDLPGWVPQGARSLVGFNMNFATASPCRVAGKQVRAHRDKSASSVYHWNVMRERIAIQVEHIRHWRVIEGDYTAAPDGDATYFVDPPYNNHAGSHYVHGPKAIDYAALGEWCRTRKGQVIVCENEGADWLPFQPFATFNAGPRSPGKGSKEVIFATSRSAAARQRPVIWTNDPGE